MPRRVPIVASLALLAACSDSTGPGPDSAPLPAVASRSTASVPTGRSGRPTAVVIQGVDSTGRPATRGGPVVTVLVRGTNPGPAAVQDEGDGTWTATYLPSRPGLDSLLIAMDGAALGGAPFTSAVELAGSGSAVIDGRIGAAEWAGASTVQVFTDPRIANSQLLVMSDATSLYLGLRVPRAVLAPFDRAFFRLDNGLDSVLTVGDDSFGVRGDGTQIDAWFDGTFFVDDRDAVRGDAAVTLVGDETHWEFRRPLVGGQDDLVTALGARIGLCVVFGIEGTTSDITSGPARCVSAGGGQRFFVVHLPAP